MLQKAVPPHTLKMSLVHPHTQAVPDEERRAIAASYLDSLTQAQMKAQETAQRRLRDLYL